MLNQLALVGRLVRDIEIRESDAGKKYSNITKEDVVNIAKKIKMDTIYILEGDINEND